MKVKMSECHRNNLCVDCDNKECWFAGELISDCPLWKCNREGKMFEDCESCELLKVVKLNDRRRKKQRVNTK